MQINLLRKLDLTERGERGKGLFLLRSVTPFLPSGLGSRGERRLFLLLLLLLLLPLKQMGRLSSSPKSSFSHLFLSHPVGREGGNSFAVAVLLDVFFSAISPTGLFLQRKGGTNELVPHFGRGEMDSASGHHQIFSRDGRNFVASAPSSIRGQFRFLLTVVYLQSVYSTICLLERRENSRLRGSAPSPPPDSTHSCSGGGLHGWGHVGDKDTLFKQSLEPQALT